MNNLKCQQMQNGVFSMVEVPQLTILKVMEQL